LSSDLNNRKLESAGSLPELSRSSSFGKSSGTLLENTLKSRRTGGMAQMGEHLPSKYKDLSSFPTTAKNKYIHT
jgi:hypothetical protein